MCKEKEIARCGLCGEPMPVGEEMFMYHGYSCDCPKEAVIRENRDKKIDETLDGQM